MAAIQNEIWKLIKTKENLLIGIINIRL